MKKINIHHKIYCLFLFFLGILNKGFSQQDPQYTQYTYNMNTVNPAYAGSRETLSINLLGRSQWTGVEGAPKTATLSIHSPLNRAPNLGLGLSAIYDEIGPLKETHLYADVSYKIDLSYEGSLAFGLKGGVSFQNLNQSLLNFNTQQNINFDINNKAYPNFGFGVYYNRENFYVGISIPNILKNTFFETVSNTVTQRERSDTFYITSGYVHEITQDLQLKPALLLKYSTVFPFSFDLSATAFIQNKVELGASYRYQESLAFIAAFFIHEGLRIGYSYDFSIGDLTNYNNGSHEIMLLFDIQINSKDKRFVKYF